MKKSIGQLLSSLKDLTDQMAQRKMQMKEVLGYCGILFQAEDEMRADKNAQDDFWDGPLVPAGDPNFASMDGLRSET